MIDLKNSLWVEKYRPKKIEDLILPDNHREDFKHYIENKDIPHLVLHGPPGGGKTAMSMILTSKEGIITNQEDNLLVSNGSAKSTRGIDYVDTVIEPFLTTGPISDKLKVVYIDEGDFLTEASFKALKGIIEKYSGHSRFIITANDVHNIPEAINSRFTYYYFKQMKKEFVVDLCKKILTLEKIEYLEEDVNFILENFYPDIRKIIGELQRNSLKGKLIVDKKRVFSSEKVILSTALELIGSLKTEFNKAKIGKLMGDISNLINDPEISFRNLYQSLFFTDGIPANAKIIINKYMLTHSESLVPSMNFFAMIYEIIISMSELQRSISRNK